MRPAEPAPSFIAPSAGSSATARSGFQADPAALARAADADRVVSGAGARLDYLSAVSVELGLPDPVQEYFGPVVGRWRDLHEAAARWRRAAHAVEELATGVTSPLGGLDAAWQGRMSDSFLEHMGQVGRATTSASDAMAAMADVLDRTGEAMHQLVTDTVDLLAGGAERVSLALLLPVDGPARAGSHIAELHGHGRRILEAVHELLEAFARMCQSLDERQPFAEVGHVAAFPARDWTPPPEPGPPEPGPPEPGAPAVAQPPADEPAKPEPSVPAGGPGHAGSSHAVASHAVAGHGVPGGAAPPGATGAHAAPPAPPEPAMRTFAAEPAASGQAATATGAAATGAAAAGRGAAGAAGAPFMPFMSGAAGQGGDSERRAKSNLTADPVEIFGEPSKTAPPVIGDD